MRAVKLSVFRACEAFAVGMTGVVHDYLLALYPVARLGAPAYARVKRRRPS